MRSALRATALALATILGALLIKVVIAVCVSLWPLDWVFGVPALGFWPPVGSEKIILIRAAIGYPFIFVALALLSLWVHKRTGWGIGVVVLLVYGVDLLRAAGRVSTAWDDIRYPVDYLALATNVLFPICGALLLRAAAARSPVIRRSPVATSGNAVPREEGIPERRLLRRLLVAIAAITVLALLVEAFITFMTLDTPTIVG